MKKPMEVCVECLRRKYGGDTRINFKPFQLRHINRATPQIHQEVEIHKGNRIKKCFCEFVPKSDNVAMHPQLQRKIDSNNGGGRTKIYNIELDNHIRENYVPSDDCDMFTEHLILAGLPKGKDATFKNTNEFCDIYFPRQDNNNQVRFMTLVDSGISVLCNGKVYRGDLYVCETTIILKCVRDMFLNNDNLFYHFEAESLYELPCDGETQSFVVSRQVGSVDKEFYQRRCCLLSNAGIFEKS